MSQSQLTLEDLQNALRSLKGQIELTKGAFIEGGRGGWFVGRNGLSFSEPDVLDDKGVWEGKNNRYFPTALEALAHAKTHGYLPKKS